MDVLGSQDTGVSATFSLFFSLVCFRVCFFWLHLNRAPAVCLPGLGLEPGPFSPLGRPMPTF